MKHFVIFMIMLAGFFIISTENALAENCLPIELEYSIVGGNVTELCKSDTNVQVNAKIQAIDKGQLIIEIPQKVVYSLSGLNCELGELFVLMDGYETLLDNVTSDKNHNIITVSFSEGNHTIAFVGSFILPKPGPSDYCGIVMGYDSLYLPPKFQEKKEVSLKHIRCNDGLVVLAKYDGSPACVKYSTGVKLLERGWGMCSDELNYDRGNPCGPSSSGVVLFEPNPEPAPMKLSELGKLTTISEYNIKTSVGDISMPTYLPPEIRIESERLQGDITTFFCLPNSIQSNDDLTLTQIQKQGLVIQITRNYDNNDWKKTVEFLVEEAPEVRSKSTFKGLDILLVHSKEFNEYHAITSVDNIKIEIFSEKFDDLQLEKVLRSMFNA